MVLPAASSQARSWLVDREILILMQTQVIDGELVFPANCPGCGSELQRSATGVDCPKGDYHAHELPRPTLKELYERLGFDFTLGKWVDFPRVNQRVGEKG